MKLLKTADAEGHILCHDMTQVVPGKSKETRFRRGHTIQAEDIPVLLDMGKEQIYVWEARPGYFHEEEGAEHLRLLCQGANLRAAPVREGKIELFAECPGLLTIDSEKLIALNSIDGIAVITRQGNSGVQEGEKTAALKIIPLLIEEQKLKQAAEICGSGKIINIVSYKRKKAGLIITGSEVYQKRIPETGSGIIRKKLEALTAECAEIVVLDDDHEKITRQIVSMIERGFEIVICTGGMSVDPDDKTPLAIKNTGARVISYGVPLMPGTMLMLAYFDRSGESVPVIGAPACVFYEHTTALDILLPSLMADIPICRKELARLGEGGLLRANNKPLY